MSPAPAAWAVDITTARASALALSLAMAALVGQASLAAGAASTKAASVQGSVQGSNAVPGPELAKAPATPMALSSSASLALAQWKTLKQSSTLPFSSYASFLVAHRGWPGEASLRSTAERRIDAATSPAEAIAYFRVHPALTAVGHARHAFALSATGAPQEAREAGRAAWRAGAREAAVEARLLELFGSALTADDHEARIETLLGEGQLPAARRALIHASAARRPIHEARIALQENAAEAGNRVASLGTAANDPGLVVDRFSWLRRNGQAAAARSLLAQLRDMPGHPHKPGIFLKALLAGAQGAAADRNWLTAYQIAAQIRGAYPTGTRVPDRPMGERDDYTSLAWLGGTIALHRLGRPADAAAMFETYAQGGRSAQVLTKGYYWAGRAAQAAGQADKAKAHFEKAGAYPEIFYGQLSLERLGRAIQAPAELASGLVSATDRTSFQQQSLVQVVRLLGSLGQREEQSVFVRALSEKARTTAEQTLAAELAVQVARPDLAVWLARNSRNEGSQFYSRAAYPEVQVPPAQRRFWSLAHGIIRQESSFDRDAVSHAGARGMMQLMPGTGREVAGKLGLAYDQPRLTRDPEYNIMLGSHYFESLMSYWANNAALAAASYNAGPGNVRKWIRENGDPRLPGEDIVKWIEDIPFSETRGYVQRVLENAVVYDAMQPSRALAPEQGRLSYYLGKQGRPG